MITREKLNEYLVKGYCRPTRFKGFVWDHVDLFSDELLMTLVQLDKQIQYSKAPLSKRANPAKFDIVEIVTTSKIAEKIAKGNVLNQLMGQDYDTDDATVSEVMTFVTMKNFLF
jgi:hypothetical protein